MIKKLEKKGCGTLNKNDSEGIKKILCFFSYLLDSSDSFFVTNKNVNDQSPLSIMLIKMQDPNNRFHVPTNFV